MNRMPRFKAGGVTRAVSPPGRPKGSSEARRTKVLQ